MDQDKKIVLPEMNPVVVSDEITDFIVKHVLGVGSSGCVVGLSGGIDSTTTLFLVKKAFDRHNLSSPNNKLKVVALIIPSSVSEEEEQNAVESANYAGVDYQIINIDLVLESFYDSLKELNLSPKARGNLISRVRANILSSFAEVNNKIVCGTGNADEDFGVGYYTLFGDGAVHMSPIAGLSKRLVRQMAAFLGVPEKTINQTPAAGLEPGQTDFKDLGYSYGLVEIVKEGLNQGFSERELVANEEVINTAKKDMQDYNACFGSSKFSDVREMVKDIIKRNILAKLKSKLVSPPFPKISLDYKK